MIVKRESGSRFPMVNSISRIIIEVSKDVIKGIIVKLDKPLPKANPSVSMRSTAFTFILLTMMAAALWLGQRQIFSTDPNIPINLIFFLFALFIGAGSLGALLSWALWARRWAEPKGYRIAIRQGIWVGLFVALIATLLVWQLLSWLAAGALVLVFVGLEALLLLQPERGTAEAEETDTKRVEP